MNRTWSFLAVCWMSLSLLFARGAPALSQSKTVSPEKPHSAAQKSSDESALKIHDQINGYRTSQGLKPLQLDPFLSRIATDHSRKMADAKVEFGHQGFEERAKTIQEKVKFSAIAENVGMSMEKSDPEEEVVKGWIKSPGHLKNIQGEFELTGIGTAEGNGKRYVTQIFVKRIG